MNRALGILQNPKTNEFEVVDITLEPNLDGKTKTKIKILSSYPSQMQSLLGLQTQFAKMYATLLTAHSNPARQKESEMEENNKGDEE